MPQPKHYKQIKSALDLFLKQNPNSNVNDFVNLKGQNSENTKRKYVGALRGMRLLAPAPTPTQTSKSKAQAPKSKAPTPSKFRFKTAPKVFSNQFVKTIKTATKTIIQKKMNLVINFKHPINSKSLKSYEPTILNKIWNDFISKNKRYFNKKICILNFKSETLFYSFKQKRDLSLGFSSKNRQIKNKYDFEQAFYEFIQETETTCDDSEVSVSEFDFTIFLTMN